jgi:hypothetical protein
MFVFVAHTVVEKEFAFETAQRIREAGHEAFAGEQIHQMFSAMSFANRDIAKALRAADALVAFALDYMFYKYVAAEVAFFSGHTQPDRTILVTTHDLLDESAPAHLLGRRVVYFEGNKASTIDAILEHVAAIRAGHRRGADQVFLSYSRLDLRYAENVHDQLVRHGYKIWFDRHTLIAGQQWDLEIEKAIAESRVFLPLVSSSAISKRGYFQRELRRSLSVAEEMPEGTVYIIPVLLDEECARSLPQALKKYHWILWRGLDVGGQLERALDFALGVDRADADFRSLVQNPVLPWDDRREWRWDDPRGS